MQKDRPLGVTILSILAILGGIGFLISGSAAFALVPLAGIIIGGALILIGLAYFVMAYGLWKGKKWAWTITLILSIIGIILGILSLFGGNMGAIFQILINAIVIYYLYRPNVKAYFGK
jgi:hypothetical protein